MRSRRAGGVAVFEGLRGVHIGDYSTNEPTMDGAASAILLFTLEAAAGR